MKHYSLDKLNVAWFNLAEFIQRGEKERALGIYRLLMHSIGDDAVALQLQGDIFSAFSDEKAFDVYVQSARMYQENTFFSQAVSLYRQALMVAIELRQFDKVQKLFADVQLPKASRVWLHAQYVVGLLNSDVDVDRILLNSHIRRVLFEASDKYVTQFLAKLAALDDEAHTFACEIISSFDSE